MTTEEMDAERLRRGEELADALDRIGSLEQALADARDEIVLHEHARSVNDNVIRELEDKNTTLDAEFVAFKRRVVEEAEDVRREMDWCYAGLKDHLAHLGLEPLPRTYSGTFTVMVHVDAMHIEDDTDVWTRVSDAVDDFENEIGRYTPGNVRLVELSQTQLTRDEA